MKLRGRIYFYESRNLKNGEKNLKEGNLHLHFGDGRFGFRLFSHRIRQEEFFLDSGAVECIHCTEGNRHNLLGFWINIAVMH